MKPRNLPALLTAWIAAGCATCAPETFTRPTADAQVTGFSVTQERNRIEFRAKSYFWAAVVPCTYQTGQEGIGNFCFVIRVAEGRKARLEDQKLVLVDRRDGRESTRSIARFRYMVICETHSGAPKSCSSPEESPIRGDLKVEHVRSPSYRDWSATISVLSFDASEEFVGTRGKEGTADDRLFDETERWRAYTAVLVKESLVGSTLTLVLPAIVVDGKRFALPQIRLDTVTETVCHTTELI